MAILDYGDPGDGSFGMTPSRFTTLGGFKVRAQGARSSAGRCTDDAIALAEQPVALSTESFLECDPRRKTQ